MVHNVNLVLLSEQPVDCLGRGEAGSGVFILPLCSPAITMVLLHGMLHRLLIYNFGYNQLVQSSD